MRFGSASASASGSRSINDSLECILAPQADCNSRVAVAWIMLSGLLRRRTEYRGAVARSLPFTALSSQSYSPSQYLRPLSHAGRAGIQPTRATDHHARRPTGRDIGVPPCAAIVATPPNRAHEADQNLAAWVARAPELRGGRVRRLERGQHHAAQAQGRSPVTPGAVRGRSSAGAPPRDRLPNQRVGPVS